jgi:hypothetical protein
MYPWSKHAADPGQAGQVGQVDQAGAKRPQAPARATQAVQVALDRRDNGGDAAAEPAAALARQ